MSIANGSQAGVNGLLDVSRVTYKEAVDDAYHLMKELNEAHGLDFELKYDNVRQFFLRLPASDLEHHALPAVITNVIRKKQWIECSTLDLVKLNQKIHAAHQEILLMSDSAVQGLLSRLRVHVPDLFKICEGIAMLDMLSSFASIVTTHEYVRPQLTDTLAIKSARHPIKERVQSARFVPNDVYATQTSRFQIITGCNMSGKSTYIQSIALLAIMSQVGSFVPATYASFPIFHQLFARASTDDSIEANVSTFAAEMREAAFILRNVERRSLAIIDELGRGTSPRDGLAIAIAIAEALVNSHALVWFATHFGDLARILAERSGVLNLHLAVDLNSTANGNGTNTSRTGEHRNRADDETQQTIKMHYSITNSYARNMHYGLAVAQLVPLPPEVLETARQVTHKLESIAQQKHQTSDAVFRERRRKLILNLKEHLVQARDGALHGDVLRGWLKELQNEFVRRMSAIEAERSLATSSTEHANDGTVSQQSEGAAS